MESSTNWRGFQEKNYPGEHLTLEELRNRRAENGYIYSTMPDYPRPQFHLFYVKHDTNRVGLEGIHADKGFRSGIRSGSEDPCLWWSMVVTPKDIQSAEDRMLEETYPDRTEEQRLMQPRFLADFATSAAFRETSRLGSFRFTFTLREVLDAYGEQFCDGKKPVMRVYKTTMYKKEIMYAVLVHSPKLNGEFSHFPLLTDDASPVCGYNKEAGHMIWKAEAMCDTHRYRLMRADTENRMTAEPWNEFPKYFVWDNVTLAFHVGDEVWTFGRDKLRDSLTISSPDCITIGTEFFDRPAALRIVQRLWPEYQEDRVEPDQDVEERGKY
ncbi:uncharacterized protein LOC130516571 [Takifugu flavidus]|uniref:uncharacterized protein LOC130516571 n=1 Tax=Takifugu flavidus TaxID=433684 RepID=UPI0025448570|nr:uncharacterized protein LOC130516571 [Takifugu flavidus]